MRHRPSISVEVSDLVDQTTTELQRLQEEVEGESTGSSDSSSLELFGSELAAAIAVEEEEEEVDQVGGSAIIAFDVVDLVLVIGSDEEAIANSKFPSVLLALGDEVAHSFVRGKGIDSNSELHMPPKAKNLGDALAPQKAKVVHAPTVQDPIQFQGPAVVPTPASE